MSSGFTGSIVLKRTGFGVNLVPEPLCDFADKLAIQHTSITQHSTCAYKAIGNYFSNHTLLPDSRTKYEPNEPLF